MIFIYFCGKPLARPQRQDEPAEADIFPSGNPPNIIEPG